MRNLGGEGERHKSHPPGNNTGGRKGREVIINTAHIYNRREGRAEMEFW